MPGGDLPKIAAMKINGIVTVYFCRRLELAREDQIDSHTQYGNLTALSLDVQQFAFGLWKQV
jgi:hypothetical protein